MRTTVFPTDRKKIWSGIVLLWLINLINTRFMVTSQGYLQANIEAEQNRIVKLDLSFVQKPPPLPQSHLEIITRTA